MLTKNINKKLNICDFYYQVNDLILKTVYLWSFFEKELRQPVRRRSSVDSLLNKSDCFFRYWFFCHNCEEMLI